jgi:hypothetical protein
MFLSLLFAARSWLFDQDERGGGSNNDDSTGDASPEPAGEIESDVQDQDQDDDQVQMHRDRFNRRLQQERRAGVRELLTGMGFENIDDPNSLQAAQQQLGELIQYARDQRQAEQSASERLEGDLETERTQHQQTRDALQSAQAQLTAFVRRDALLSQANDAVDPEDVVIWARTHRPDDYEDILVDDEPIFTEDGVLNSKAVDQDAVQRIIEECRKEKKHFWEASQNRRKTPGSPSNSDARDAGEDLAQQKQLAKDIVRRTMGGGGIRRTNS